MGHCAVGALGGGHCAVEPCALGRRRQGSCAVGVLCGRWLERFGKAV